MRTTSLALLGAPIRPDVKVYQNDSLPSSGTGTLLCQAGFIADEVGAPAGISMSAGLDVEISDN